MTDPATRILALALTVAVAACGAGPTSDVSLEAEEQAIRELDEQWAQTALDRDPAGFASFYAENGRLMPPNAPTATGPGAVEQVLEQILTPNTTLEISSTEIHVSEAGDMAYDIGMYALEVETPDGTVEDEGKYLVVWQKVDGEWKVVADMFNSNLPAQ